MHPNKSDKHLHNDIKKKKKTGGRVMERIPNSNERDEEKQMSPVHDDALYCTRAWTAARQGGERSHSIIGGLSISCRLTGIQSPFPNRARMKGRPTGCEENHALVVEIDGMNPRVLH